MKTKFIYLLVCFITTTTIFSQKNVQEAETMAKSEFKKMHKHEVDEMKMTEKQYVDFKINEYKNQQVYYTNILNKKSVSDLCSNGDFENGQILASEWDAYWSGPGVNNSGSSIVNSGSFTTLTPNHALQVHHQVIAYGNDPSINLLKTTMGPLNKFSLRLGNKIDNFGLEKISKKITVTKTNSVLSFSYALVLEESPHGPTGNPGFGVNIFDPITLQNFNSLVNLGNNSNMITSDNPLMTVTNGVSYKNWSCIKIDLSSLINKTVVIEFFNRDCTGGAHWGYSYLDNICLDCEGPDPEGTVKLNIGKTDNCGPGKICVNYTLPNAPNPSMIISLNLTQNGVIKKTLFSPNLTSGTETCFNITSTEISLMNPSLNGFEYHLIAKPKSGSFTFPDKRLGSLAEGVVNNKIDYNLSCPPPIQSYSPCCPPMVKTDIYPMFTPVFQGGASGPYTMKFTMPQSMKDGMQAYINLLKHTCKAKQLIINWQLCEVTASGGCTNLETKAVIFTAGSTIPTIPTFFTTTLQQDKQYRITVIYKYDGEKCFDKTCDDPLVKPFEWDIDKKMGTIINKSN